MFLDYKDELKNQFQKSGLLENLKVQMRYKILEKLQNNKKENELERNENYQENDKLEYRLICSLFDDFLQEHQLNYSRSVYLPEIKIELINKESLQKILNLEVDRYKCVLEQIINEKVKINSKLRQYYEVGVQTYESENKLDLEDKLKQIEEDYNKTRKKNNSKSINQINTMDEYKKELEIHYQIQLERETSRIREIEIAQMRIQESQKMRQENEQYRNQLEEQYYFKIEKLKERESENIFKRNQQIKNEQDSTHYLRQQIEKEYEQLKIKEEDLIRQKNIIVRERQLETDKYNLLVKELIEQQKQLEKQRLDYEKDKQYQIQQARQTIITDLQKDNEEIQTKHKILNKEITNINSLKDSNQFLQEQNRQLNKENQEYKEKVNELKKKKREMEDQISIYREQVQNMQEQLRRDQSNIKHQQEQMEIKIQEIQFYKDIVDQNQNLVQNQKNLTIEQQKQFQQEITKYQSQIEEIQNQIRIKNDTIVEFDTHLNLDLDVQQFHQYEQKDILNKQTIDKTKYELEQWKQERDLEIKRLIQNIQS